MIEGIRISIIVIVAGDSAGGNLAAAVALKLRGLASSSLPRLKAQMLIYPVLQGFDLTLPSLVENSDKLFGSQRGLARSILSYMGVPANDELVQQMVQNQHITSSLRKEYEDIMNINLLPGKYQKEYVEGKKEGNRELENKLQDTLLDPYFLPLMAKDLSDLPSTFIMSCEFDTLRDENIMYAKRLEQAGVEVTWIHYEDGFHGIVNYICPPMTLQLGIRTRDDMVAFFKEKL